jgi:PAS domain S-box-containing protein
LGDTSMPWASAAPDGTDLPQGTETPGPLTGPGGQPPEFRGLLDSAPDAMVIVSEAGRIVLVNRQAEDLFGYSRAELVGQPLEVLVPDRVRTQHPAHRAGYFADPRMRPMGVGLELTARHKDGHEVPVDIALSSFESDGRVLATAAIRDITDRIRLESELRAAKEEADAASQAKSAFLSRVSHELRTPLNAVLGFAQLLQLEPLDESHQESVTHIARAGRHLLDLINEVIDIARIESGELTLSLEPVSVDELVAETVDLVRPLAGARGITVTTAPSVLGTHVRADRQRLRQVLLNLCANAVKYNRPRGRMDVAWSTSTDGRTLRLAVTDTGVGVAADDLARLFTPFDRLGAEQGEVEGTGIGLALSLRLAEAMGGMLEVDSVVGVGSTFRLHLPVAPRPDPEHGPAAESPATAPGGDADHSCTVLYVEDNLSNVRLVERILRHRPAWRLVHTVYGASAVPLARQHLPELVLLDLHLPDLPGVDVLRALRDDPAGAHTPVFVVSADATPAQKELLLRSGADGYVTKPLEVQALLDLLDRVAVPGG